MDESLATEQYPLPAEQAEEIIRSFVMSVFGWMSFGLFITGATAMLTVESETMLGLIFGSQIVFFGLIIAQLGLVGWLSLRVAKMSAATATIVFLSYSALTGVTLSVIFLTYTAESLGMTFFVTAGTFGLTAAYGYLTKTDLSKFGGFLVMGLIGLILASVVNMFLQSEMIYWITTYIGIGIFVGLTAWDMQKLRKIALTVEEGSEQQHKATIIGALALYLDFVNLFLLLLRILGRKK